MQRQKTFTKAFGQFRTERITLSGVIAELLSSPNGDGLHLLPKVDLITLIDTVQEVSSRYCVLRILYIDVFKLIDANDPNRRLLERRLKRLVLKSGVFPSNLFVHGAKRVGRNAVAGGGFADIWQGKLLDGTIAALKVLCLFKNTEEERARTNKVCTADKLTSSYT